MKWYDGCLLLAHKDLQRSLSCFEIVEDEIIIRINGSTIDEAAEGRGSHDTHQSPPKGASSSIIFFLVHDIEASELAIG